MHVILVACLSDELRSLCLEVREFLLQALGSLLGLLQ